VTVTIIPCGTQCQLQERSLPPEGVTLRVTSHRRGATGSALPRGRRQRPVFIVGVGSKCPVQLSPEELAHDGATWNSSPPLGLVVAMDEHDELHPAIAL